MFDDQRYVLNPKKEGALFMYSMLIFVIIVITNLIIITNKG